MAMSPEFVLTPWPASPLWPLFRLLKRRVPHTPEPSLVDLFFLSVVVGPLAAVLQITLSLPQNAYPALLEVNTKEGGFQAEEPPVHLIGKTLFNLKHLFIISFILRFLHWSTKRIFWLRLAELISYGCNKNTQDERTAERILPESQIATEEPVHTPQQNEQQQNENLRPPVSSEIKDTASSSCEQKAHATAQTGTHERGIPGGPSGGPPVGPPDGALGGPSGGPPVGPPDGTVKGTKIRSRRFGFLNENKIIKTLVVLGSGGHTSEMLRLLEEMDLNKFRCVFILGNSDKISQPQAEEMLKNHKSLQGKNISECITFISIPRCREVCQPLRHVLLPALHAFVSSIRIIFKEKPRLILMNGPGTCVPVAVAALLYEFLLGFPLKIIYIESFCRVSSLSLTGTCLYTVADRFLLQWRPVAAKFRFADYTGILS